MRRIVLTLFLLLQLVSLSHAIEIVRQKNQATHVVFPLVDQNGDVISGATGLDSEIDAFTDSSVPDGFVDATNEAVEVSTTGIYSLSLTVSEMNVDYLYLQVKSTEAKTQHILIRTIVGDPLNVATTQEGRTINVVSSGQVGVDFSDVNGSLDASEISTDAITSDKIAVDAIGSSELANGAIDSMVAPNLDASVSSRSNHSASDVWSQSVRTLSSGANIVLSKGLGITGFNDISVNDVWTASVRTLTANTNFNDPTVGDIADAVWNEMLSEHLTSGSTGQALNASGGSGDPWNTSLPGSYTSNQAGKILSDIFDATDGNKESGSYTGIEKTIRRNRGR